MHVVTWRNRKDKKSRPEWVAYEHYMVMFESTIKSRLVNIGKNRRKMAYDAAKAGYDHWMNEYRGHIAAQVAVWEPAAQKLKAWGIRETWRRFKVKRQPVGADDRFDGDTRSVATEIEV